MDDLALLTEMADRTPLPAAADLAPARERLMSAIDESQKYVTDSARARRRFLGYGTAVVGLAAAITAVFALGGFGVAPPKASAAEKVLQDAAAYARTLPDTPPRPDQFVYTKVVNSYGGVREEWFSVDGTRDGAAEESGEQEATDVLFGCRDGKMPVGDPADGSFVPCVPEPVYDPAMPTDAAGLLAYLKEVHHAVPSDLDRFIGTIWELIQDRYVPPQSLAMMFDLLAKTDGITVEENVTDGAGRSGIGLAWTTRHGDMTLVFDAETFQLLGIKDGTSLMAKGIVDEVGQRP